MDAKTDLFDEDTRPNLGYELLVADHFTRVLDKDEQDIERTAAKFDRLVPFLQNALRGAKSKRPEEDNLHAQSQLRWDRRSAIWQPSDFKQARSGQQAVNSGQEITDRENLDGFSQRNGYGSFGQDVITVLALARPNDINIRFAGIRAARSWSSGERHDETQPRR
jgi:hypothetical protein